MSELNAQGALPYNQGEEPRGSGGMANDAGVKQAAALALGEPGCRLPLTLTVGFAGHRELTAEVGKALEAAFALVKAALARLEETPLYGGEARLGGAYEGRSQLRLLTGDAPGADRLAIERWQAIKLGEVHRLYPYRDAGTGAPLTDRPSRAKPEDHLAPPAPGSAWTGIDAVDLDLRISGHAEVGRWLVRHADVLVALWDGAPGHGPGGTADTVLRTFEHRAPVLWVRPGHTEVRLIRPPKLGLAEAASQLMEKAAEDAEVASATALAAILAEAFAPPGEMLASGPNPEIRTRVDCTEKDGHTQETTIGVSPS